jgi:glutathione S-transferase
MAEFEFYYFGIRGRGEASRLLFELTGTPYKNKFVTNWAELKPKTPFGQLPYLIHGDLQLAQSMAIIRYIARLTNKYGNSPQEAAKIDMVLEGEEDVRNRYTMLIYSSLGMDYERDKDDYLKNFAPTHFTSLEKLLKSNNEGKGWFVGSDVTVADVAMFELLDIHLSLSPTILDSFPFLKEFHQRFAALAPVKKYIESGRRPSKINYNGKGQ